MSIEMDLLDLNTSATYFSSSVRKAETTNLYCSTLVLQATLYQDELEKFLGECKPWKKATSVLEVGCGPGEGAKILSDAGLLKGKTYCGVDIEDSFVKRASDRNVKSKNLRFVRGDILTNDFGKYDLIFAIAVLQHLGELAAAIKRLNHHLNDHGVMVFFDAGSDNISESRPPIPALKEMYDHISASATGGKRNDKCLIELEGRASDFGFKIEDLRDVKMPVGESKRDDFIRYSFFASELSKRFYKSPISQEKLLEELLHWKNSNGTASLTGWRWLVAKKF